jgi:hypothetical protein
MGRSGVWLVFLFAVSALAATVSTHPDGPRAVGGAMEGAAPGEQITDAVPVLAVRPVRRDPLVPPLQVDGLLWDEDGPTTPVALAATSLWADEFVHDERAHFHAHGSQYCSSGCAPHNHPTADLTAAKYRALVERFSGEPMDETSLALESLLYFGRQTRLLAAREGISPLTADRADFLRRELSRTHARIAIRLVDEAGKVRAWAPPTRVPLDRRHVFEMEVEGVQPLITSGTVKRVGLYHLWNRL